MVDMMKVLSVVVENAGKSAEEIINAVRCAFPRESYVLLEGYIRQLGKEGYLSIQAGDNRIVAIYVNPSAYIALHESKNAPEEKASTQINIGTISDVSGQVAVGNKGGSYEMHVSKTIIHEMSKSLKDVLALSDRKITDDLEREQIKRLIQRILESVEKSEPPPKNLIENLDSFMQRHSWIAAPLATALLNVLAKLF